MSKGIPQLKYVHKQGINIYLTYVSRLTKGIRYDQD